MTPAELKAWAQEVWQEPGITSTDRASRRNRFIEGKGGRPVIVPGAESKPSPTFGLSPAALKRRRKLQTFSPYMRAAVLAEATVTTKAVECYNLETRTNETKLLPLYTFTPDLSHV